MLILQEAFNQNAPMRITYLTLHNADSNKHRFYQMFLVLGIFGDWGLVREWGRIGSGGQIRSDWFETEEQALNAGLKIRKSKINKGYKATEELVF